MEPTLQLDFFSSLDFPGRSILTVDDVARKLGVSFRHVVRLAETGEMTVMNMNGVGARRALVRIPLESYRAFVVKRMSGPMRSEFIASLPRAVQRELLAELNAILAVHPQP